MARLALGHLLFADSLLTIGTASSQMSIGLRLTDLPSKLVERFQGSNHIRRCRPHLVLQAQQSRAQDGAGKLGKEALDQVEPGAVRVMLLVRRQRRASSASCAGL
jgi:hypothetical protein